MLNKIGHLTTALEHQGASHDETDDEPDDLNGLEVQPRHFFDDQGGVRRVLQDPLVILEHLQRSGLRSNDQT